MNYTNMFNKKTIIISILILLICCSTICLSVFAYNKIFDNIKNNLQIELPSDKQDYSEYKSITPLYSEIDMMTEKQALEKIIQQEQDLKEFLNQKHTSAENSILFVTFYKNLVNVSEKLDKLVNNEYNSVSLSDKTTTIIKGIQFSPNQINRENLTGYYIVTEPKTNLFRTTFAVPNDNVEPNYTYIFNQFSKYLEKPYQDYLNHKMQEQIRRKDCALWVYEHRNKNITKDKLIEYILFLRKISNEYPNFALWYNLQSDIKIYLGALLFEDWERPSEPPIKNVLKKFLNVAPKGTYEFNTVEELNNLNINEDTYENSWESAYREWYGKTFYEDGTPIITQDEINIHAEVENEFYKKDFYKKIQTYKDLKLGDNGALIKYINGYNRRKDNIEHLIYPYKNNNARYHYGSSYLLQLLALEKLFNELELFTYQKIADTYLNKYEHSNKIKAQAYHEYYERVTHNILNSEYFANGMKKYLSDYDTRKNLYRQIVSNKLKDSDFSVWFDKLELYTYKIMLLGLSRFQDNSEEINKIFTGQIQ